MRKHYWYVKWAHALRFAEGSSAEEACRYAYGMVSPDMRVKDLGTRHPRYFSDKKKTELQESKEGWMAPIIKNKRLGIDT